MKQITIVSSSLRTNSSSRLLARKLLEELKKENNTEYSFNFIDLKDYNYSFCTGCLACQTTGRCVKKDDINNLLDTISNSNIIVFATPIYYYAVSGALKTFLDRLNPLYIKDNKFKDIYLITTCADTNEDAPTYSENCIKGWVDCFEQATYLGALKVLNVNETKDLEKQDCDKLIHDFALKIIDNDLQGDK